MRSKITLLLGASLLAACATGPNYKPPVTPTAAAAPFLGATSSAVAQVAPADTWWQLYRDPVLDGLIVDALHANTDVRVAVARIERARATLGGAKSERFPTVTASGSPQYGRLPAYQRASGIGRESWNVDLGLDVAYEVDLFGRVSRSNEAARGDLAAAAADADAVRVTVVADTVRAYVDATAAAQQLAVAQHTVDLLDQSVRVTDRRFQVGRGQRLDVIRLNALRQQRAALLPDFQAQRDTALFRLALLTGRTPQELPANVSARTTIPRLDQPIPVGDGAGLLARRPDVRAAERRLAADTARIGVATADLYPKITLGASGGSTGFGFGDIFGANPLRWLVGPMISWNFLNQGATRARIGEAKADSKADLATFDGTVLRALNETETALSTYAHEIDRRTALQAARNAAADAARITLARQREGEIDFISLLDAQRTLADADADLAGSDARVAVAQVNLFRALGGNWAAQPVG